MAFERGRIEDASGNVLFARATRPRGFLARLRGLLARPPLRDDEAWWFEPCAAVHTLGMRRRIDIVHVGRLGQVLDLRPNTPPASMAWTPGARCVIETGTGAAERAGITEGQIVRFVS